MSTTSVSSRSSRHAEFQFQRVEYDPPDSPFTPQPPRFFHNQPPSPLSADSQRSSQSISLSRSQSFTRPLVSPGLDRAATMPVAGSPVSGVASLAVALDSLVKMHRSDVLTLRSLAQQTREPPIGVRKVVDAVAALVSALGGGKGGRGKTAGWRELLGSSTLISVLVKVSPLAGTAAVSVTGEVRETLKAVVGEPMLEKAAYVRSLTPAVRVLWQWVLAVCRELGIERGAGGEAGGTAVTPSGTGTLAAMTVVEGAEDEAEVTLIGRAAVRARARSKSQELAAPVSPSPSDERSPRSPGGTGGREAGMRGRSVIVGKKGRGGLLTVEGGRGKDGGGGRTPSPHSAGGERGGRSRAKREAKPEASSRSQQNVHLALHAASTVRTRTQHAPSTPRDT